MPKSCGIWFCRSILNFIVNKYIDTKPLKKLSLNYSTIVICTLVYTSLMDEDMGWVWKFKTCTEYIICTISDYLRMYGRQKWLW